MYDKEQERKNYFKALYKEDRKHNLCPIDSARDLVINEFNCSTVGMTPNDLFDLANQIVDC